MVHGKYESEDASLEVCDKEMKNVIKVPYYS